MKRKKEAKLVPISVGNGCVLRVWSASKRASAGERPERNLGAFQMRTRFSTERIASPLRNAT